MDSSHVGLLGELDVEESLPGSHLVLVLDAHDATTPLSAELNVLVEVSLEHVTELVQVGHVFLADGSQGDAGGSLLVDEFAEGSLAADEAVRNALSAAESGQVHNELNGVNVVGNHDKLGLAFLNQRGHVVQTELDVVGFGSLYLTFGFSNLQKAFLLFLFGLGGIFGEQFKQLGRYNKVINLKF